MGAASAAALDLHGGITTALCGSAAAAIPMAIDIQYKLYYTYKTTKCSFYDSEIKLMPDLKEILKIAFLIKLMIAFLHPYLFVFLPY